MPKGVRHSRHDEIQDGEFVWLRTGVELGDDGFFNLRHFSPFAQDDWKLFQGSNGHLLNFVYDNVNGRIKARLQSTIAAAHTGFIRKTLVLPKDFGRMSRIKIIANRSSNSASVAYALTLFKGSVADPGVDHVSIEPAVAGTPELFTFTPTAAYFPDDFIALEVRAITSVNNHFVEVSNVEFDYLTGRGNT